jgi:hypothetical protein
VEDEPVLEVEQQVLAAALDPIEPRAVELGYREAGGPALPRRTDRHLFTRESLLDPPGDA